MMMENKNKLYKR